MPAKHGIKASPVEVQKFLKGINYPAKKQDLLQQAEDNGAPPHVLQALENMLDKPYESPADVTKSIRGSD